MSRGTQTKCWGAGTAASVSPVITNSFSRFRFRYSVKYWGTRPMVQGNHLFFALTRTSEHLDSIRTPEIEKKQALAMEF